MEVRSKFITYKSDRLNNSYHAIAVAWAIIICHCSLLPVQEPLVDDC
ncbi:hypothetical protein [Nostoc sp.]